MRSKLLYGLGVLAIWLSLGLWAGQQEIVSSPPPMTPDQAYSRIYNGWKWFHVYCFRCHGVDALGSNLAPNLRRSLGALGYREFMHTVKEGSIEKGMASWKQLLDDDQIEDIYYYVRARSDQVLPPGRPDEVGEYGQEWAPPQEWVNQLQTKESKAEEPVTSKEDS